jgi:hypothetical protein
MNFSVETDVDPNNTSVAFAAALPLAFLLTSCLRAIIELGSFQLPIC